jgi:hypothetical protein
VNFLKTGGFFTVAVTLLWVRMCLQGEV